LLSFDPSDRAKLNDSQRGTENEEDEKAANDERDGREDETKKEDLN